MAIKKSTTKKAAKKVAAKKIPAKKAAKKAPVKKTPAQKAPAKKKAVKKAAAKTITKTSIVARVDVGFGNSLYIRGEGAGLSWDKGTLMENVSPYEWTFFSTKAKGDVEFKFLINDELWADGENTIVVKGGSSVTSPVFYW